MPSTYVRKVFLKYFCFCFLEYGTNQIRREPFVAVVIDEDEPDGAI